MPFLKDGKLGSQKNDISASQALVSSVLVLRPLSSVDG